MDDTSPRNLLKRLCKAMWESSVTDPHDATGRFDFVHANPPFNVNAEDKERLKDSVGPGRRFPCGLPRTDNANHLWIRLFYFALNEKGHAGLRLVKEPDPRIISGNA